MVLGLAVQRKQGNDRCKSRREFQIHITPRSETPEENVMLDGVYIRLTCNTKLAQCEKVIDFKLSDQSQ